MHIVIEVRRRLPHKLPHFVKYDGRLYGFTAWHKQTLVYVANDGGATSMMRLQTRKVQGARYVRRIIRSDDGRSLDTIDAYRKTR